jgi:hypothetical protein
MGESPRQQVKSRLHEEFLQLRIAQRLRSEVLLFPFRLLSAIIRLASRGMV